MFARGTAVTSILFLFVQRTTNSAAECGTAPVLVVGEESIKQIPSTFAYCRNTASVQLEAQFGSYRFTSAVVRCTHGKKQFDEDADKYEC